MMGLPLRVLVAGKGGVGKTTVAALLSHFLRDRGMRVLAVDADSVPNLGMALGLPADVSRGIVPLVRNEELVEQRTGARPGQAWGVLFRVNPRVDDLSERYGVRIEDGLSLLVVGSIDAAKQGCLCPAIALAKRLLKHLVSSADERSAVVVDSEAGAEVFGRGLAENFDHMICVSEPTVASLDISKRLIKMGRQLGIREFSLIVNKVPEGGEALKGEIEVRFSADARVFFVPSDPEVLRASIEGRGVKAIPNSSPAILALSSAFSEIFG